MRKALKIIGFLSVFCLFANSVSADLTTTPTSIQPGDETTLNMSITTSATTIVLNPLYKYVNGIRTKGCINTSAGFATITDVSRTEWISFSVNSCNSSTFITTLTGVRRGLSPTAAAFNAGTGMQWDASAKFKIIDYTIIYNNSVYKDVQNTMTGSGSIESAQTDQPYLFVNHVTTTQKNKFTYGPSSSKRFFIYDDTINAMQFWNGTAYYNFGSGSTVNATESVGGKVELGSLADHIARTITGDSGSPTVVQTKNLTGSGGQHGTNNSVQKSMVPFLGQSGAVVASLGGTGLSNPSSGSILIPQGSGAMKTLAPGASGNVPTSNGVSWGLSQPSFTIVKTLTAASSDCGNVTTECTVFQYGFSGAILTAGTTFKLHVSGQLFPNGSGAKIRIRIGAASGTYLVGVTHVSSARVTYFADSSIQFRSVGGSASVVGDLRVDSNAANTYQHLESTASQVGSPSAVTISTLGSVYITAAIIQGSANGSNQANAQIGDLSRYSR